MCLIMLKIVENNNDATLYNFNFREVDKLKDKSFDLITAFRFSQMPIFIEARCFKISLKKINK